ncbi:hypothetical protein [Rhodopseudomonas sp. BAL398]|uniref:Porin n=2 Tax=Nitrobacteraceae TaxID=41294 RepID=A0A0D7ELV4_RHOPL|nr:hypothetical protein [Rhodopseudomonas sp. BAL398]KIZ41794.1 hypothetical protein OO17_14220 [Rhodopseudomonas palustris]MDF3810854.1 hypothetical protein [Rhodopseudomonas sp. BAL398]
MRHGVLAAFLIAALPVSAMADDKRATKPPPRQVKSNPCAAFGPGFVMAEGTSTCVKLGGSISVGVGSRTR